MNKTVPDELRERLPPGLRVLYDREMAQLLADDSDLKTSLTKLVDLSERYERLAASNQRSASRNGDGSTLPATPTSKPASDAVQPAVSLGPKAVNKPYKVSPDLAGLIKAGKV